MKRKSQIAFCDHISEITAGQDAPTKTWERPGPKSEDLGDHIFDNVPCVGNVRQRVPEVRQVQHDDEDDCRNLFTKRQAVESAFSKAIECAWLQRTPRILTADLMTKADTHTMAKEAKRMSVATSRTGLNI